MKGKINPYKVSAFKIGTGGFRSTGDIVRTGGFLGAIGSFDVEADTLYPNQKMINVVPEEPIFNQIKYSSTINNRYAWSLNCEDGSEYGVDSCDYETRDDYNTALEEAKTSFGDDDCNEDHCEEDIIIDVPPVSNEPFVLYRVSLLSNGKNLYATSSEEMLKIGDRVIVSADNNEAEAIVIAVEQHTALSAPPDYDKVKIIKKI